MKINSLEEIIEYSVSFIKDDFTELWVICNKICETNPELKFQEFILATKIVIYELMDKHQVCLVDENSLHPMIIEIDETLQLIEKHLNRLNRIPNIGDGYWFTIKNS